MLMRVSDIGVGRTKHVATAKAGHGRPCVLASVDSGTVPAITCDCLRVAELFMRRRFFDLCVCVGVFENNAYIRK